MARTPQVNLKNFRRAARAAGISVAAWCRGATVSRVHLYKVLAGDRKPGPALSAKLRRFVGEHVASADRRTA